METVRVGASGGGRASGGDPFELVGTTIADKYRIERVLGEGGFGVVYAGTHLVLGTAVAVKVMKPLAGTTEQADRAMRSFVREARTLFGLTHPGIVRMYDVGTLKARGHELPYVVLEQLEGRTLEDEINARARDRRPFGNAEIRALFDTILDALAFAHGSGVAHLDLKPSNIMILAASRTSGPADAPRVKILDFGLAKLVSGEGATQTSMSAFTPAYAAPEQWSEGMGDPGPRTDVFAMGLTLAESLTLSPALSARTPAQIFSEVMKPSRKVNLAETARVGLPPGLQHVIDRALCTDPQMRYADAAAMRDELLAVFSGKVPEPVPLLPPTFGHPRGGPPTPPVDHVAETMPASVARLAGAAANRTRPAPAARSSLGLVLALGAGAVALLGAGGVGVAAYARSTRAPTHRTPDARAIDRPATRAKLRTEVLTAGTHFTEAALAQVATSREGAILGCYTKRLAEVPRFDDTVQLFLVVRPSGEVFEHVDLVDLGRRNAGGPEDKVLHACVAQEARTWHFPAHDKADVEGVLYTFRFDTSRHAPPPVDVARGAMTSTFDNHGKKYEDRAATSFERADVLGLDYEDGVAICVDQKPRVLCRWVQLDSMGLASLEWDKPRKTLKGTWGYWPSDKGEGDWALARK